MQKSGIPLKGLYVALFITTTNLGCSNVNPGDNANEFNLLCRLVALAENTPPHATAETANDADLEDIMRLNMSLSAPEWLQMFVKNAADNDVHKTQPETVNKENKWEPYWKHWHKAAQDILKKENLKIIDDMKLSTLTPAQKQAVTTEVRQLTEKAYQIKTRREELAAELSKVKTSPGKTLKIIVYGNKDKKAATVDQNDAFQGGGTSYSAACTGNSASIKVKSVAGLIACLCAKADSNQEDRACGTTVKIATAQWTVASPPASTDVTEPLTFCNKATPKKLTANYIKAILEDLESAIKVKAAAGVLGASETGNSCGGKNNDGLCVKVDDWAANGVVKLGKITWLKQLETLAEELEEQEQAVAEAAELDKRIKNIKQKTLKVGANSWHIKEEDTAKQKDNADQRQANSAGTRRDQAKAEKECNAAGDDKNACDKLKGQGCTFKEDGKKDKKCTLSENAKQEVTKEANQETGGNDGEKEEKCAGKEQKD
ncbi:variant surface glycoprotein (VSG), putative [Trypanosoma brucei brucei TREU927]|uniref:Variant surface glycoprotein (VSG), putative n=2 Tax=Trypanosoma brucei TaxID=5691 RepID=Q4FKF4_TRYB2|nr:variant surface glycoprotein [Trypanosoma brucei brucei TREU927]AGH59923.1 variant surface glycoprotein 752 [Trypanosoma brucei]EAN78989.1 variant surface glycoprotein (VSG), putative [Trypanosoma brucei brucei TREU927]CAJ17035.1 variant surface glycoprotein (VSG), putative [Trypanosoma brucei brucei TREU927]